MTFVHVFVGSSLSLESILQPPTPPRPSTSTTPTPSHTHNITAPHLHTYQKHSITRYPTYTLPRPEHPNHHPEAIRAPFKNSPTPKNSREAIQALVIEPIRQHQRRHQAPRVDTVAHPR